MTIKDHLPGDPRLRSCQVVDLDGGRILRLPGVREDFRERLAAVLNPLAAEPLVYTHIVVGATEISNDHSQKMETGGDLVWR